VCNTNNTQANATRIPENAASNQAVRKFKFRVDVPPFEPTGFVTQLSRSPRGVAQAQDELGREPKSDALGDRASSPISRDDCALSYPYLYWCPPGTASDVLLKAAISCNLENAQLIDVGSETWADGGVLESDMCTMIQRCTGLTSCPEKYQSVEVMKCLRLLLEDVARRAEAPLAPALIILRDAGFLPQTKLSKKSQRGSDAIAMICGLVDVLASMHHELAECGFKVTVVLEGWPSAIPIGRHTTRSLALPRVSRRPGKTKRVKQVTTLTSSMVLP
jgi:hypothetical protein